jgi:hypothetical protein
MPRTRAVLQAPAEAQALGEAQVLAETRVLAETLALAAMQAWPVSEAKLVLAAPQGPRRVEQAVRVARQAPPVPAPTLVPLAVPPPNPSP